MDEKRYPRQGLSPLGLLAQSYCRQDFECSSLENSLYFDDEEQDSEQYLQSMKKGRRTHRSLARNSYYSSYRTLYFIVHFIGINFWIASSGQTFLRHQSHLRRRRERLEVDIVKRAIVEFAASGIRGAWTPRLLRLQDWVKGKRQACRARPSSSLD